jgi:uncharacterized protein (DUF2267 family)
MTPTHSHIDVELLIEEVRAEAGPQLVSARQQAEQATRDFLDSYAGRMSREQAQQLAKMLNTHEWGPGVRHSRFLPAFSKPLIDQMTQDMDNFNQVTLDLWRGDIDDALAVADHIFRDPSILPGSGRSYPATLLYIRDPQRFAVWTRTLENGLAAVTDYDSARGRSDVDAYLAFCTKAKALRERFEIAPEELDAILARAARTLTQEPTDETKPTITRAAIDFLADLAEHNDKNWLNENRDRYESQLRDPVAAVFEEVAAGYMRDIDPKLITAVKRDKVLARLNKYAPGPPYYEYYWGAFSRFKKQEDVQLFINVQKKCLRFGLYLGSAPAERRQRLANAADHIAETILPKLKELAPSLRWEASERGESIPVETGDDLSTWALSKDPQLAVELEPDDPLVGSSHLVDTIGRTFEALHPMAAIAWGDEIDTEMVPPDSAETSGPLYTFEKLLADTHLPADTLQEWIDLLNGPKKAALFYGPPGTGKTFVVDRLARHLVGSEGEMLTVQFHPSFTYEDFIEGLRPETTDGQLSYTVRPGVFREFCDQARGKDALFVCVVDEINRAELGAVLGEVMMLVEYRGRTVPLPYSQEPFSIPKNIVLLATMNTADRSLALVDFALRRRFHAIAMRPDRAVLSAAVGSEGSLAVEMFDLVQGAVGDDAFAPGHSYWMTADLSAEGLIRVWKYEIEPYLREYWFESKTRLVELEQQVMSLLSSEGI